ncbi:hypothetical protein NDU88_008156 [Pleurodeles waltl]|uniref:Uncharacterized protein n=1 Tax=Pleurodeles waltl TaxID=8319 RepID=A0AAV7RUY5_PLEWA|nr:hypothetical protein NDU88_008156 [Pleurodeles waltl]
MPVATAGPTPWSTAAFKPHTEIDVLLCSGKQIALALFNSPQLLNPEPEAEPGRAESCKPQSASEQSRGRRTPHRVSVLGNKGAEGAVRGVRGGRGGVWCLGRGSVRCRLGLAWTGLGSGCVATGAC